MMMIISALYQTKQAELDFFYSARSLNNSLRIDMSIHSDSLCPLPIQPALALTLVKLCAQRRSSNYTLYGLWFDPRSSATRPRKRHLYDLPVHVVMLKSNALGHIMPTSGPTSPFSYSRKTVCLYAEQQQLQKVFGLTQLGLVPTIYRRPKLLSPVCIVHKQQLYIIWSLV